MPDCKNRSYTLLLCLSAYVSYSSTGRDGEGLCIILYMPCLDSSFFFFFGVISATGWMMDVMGKSVVE